MESADLNATLLSWPAGDGVASHRNAECDVLVVVLTGSLGVVLDGATCEVPAGQLLLLPRGSERSLTAGASGARYLSVHPRRGPLLPRPRESAAESEARAGVCAGPKS